MVNVKLNKYGCCPKRAEVAYTPTRQFWLDIMSNVAVDALPEGECVLSFYDSLN